MILTNCHLMKLNCAFIFFVLFIKYDTGDVRYIVREVVLLSSDRNLRVKALTNDIPVRELPDFVRWAGLGSDL